MLFRPTFCAHCGERIERVQWYPWTTRRFCPMCEAEYKGQDLLQRGAMALCIAIGLFGIGSYLKSGPSPEMRVSREPQRFVERQPAVQVPSLRPPVETQTVSPGSQVPIQPEISPPLSAAPAPAPPPVPMMLQRPMAKAEQVVRYCGAETKKGTPCARRVKNSIRCYQHAGMPAMSVAAGTSPTDEKTK